MMKNKIMSYSGKKPKLHKSVFVADGAIIIGDVVIEEESSIWFNTVIRGDVNYIRIGKRTNIQDNSVLHVTTGTAPLNIGSDITIGHKAILHGCTIEDKCLIGMGSVVMDGAHIHKNSIIGAGSVVLEGFELPEGTLAVGVPAKIKRTLTNEEKEVIFQSAINYAYYAKTYRS